MPHFSRYAVYYAPQSGDLANFTAGWLGWDPSQGVPRAHPDIAGLPRAIADLVAEPHKYGFHGTIKPPFHLADGITEADLIHALDQLATGLRPVVVDGMAVRSTGSFVAVVPTGDTASLVSLAAAVIEGLDRFRAPLRDVDRARRNPDRLTPHQRDLLDRWGYPYVMDQFKFHLTLTGALTDDEASRTQAVLAPLITPLLPDPFIVGDLALFAQAENGRFHIIHRAPLG